MSTVCSYLRTPEEEKEIALFYAERILEQAEAEYFLMAQQNFQQYRSTLSALLQPQHFAHLAERANQPDQWNEKKENRFQERLKNAWIFSEHKTVHDCAYEILLHHRHTADSCPTHTICDQVNEILAANNAVYIEPDELSLNTFVDAVISFVVDHRRLSATGQQPLNGNPGFYLIDAVGKRYRCFVKEVSNSHPGDLLKLKITNIPGLAVANKRTAEPILYLEPRVIPGDIIEVELADLSYTGNSFTFRHYSYDGFLWFKRRGVNKEIFNRNSLHSKDRIIAKVLYTSEEVQKTENRSATRLGIIKAILWPAFLVYGLLKFIGM